MNKEFTKDGFTIIPKKFIDLIPTLGVYATTVYLALIKRVNHDREDDEVWPSYETIKKDTGIGSDATISAALKALKFCGFIEKKRRYGNSSKYRVTTPSDEYFEVLLNKQLSDMQFFTSSRSEVMKDDSSLDEELEKVEDLPVLHDMKDSSSRSEVSVLHDMKTNNNNLINNNLINNNYSQTEKILEKEVEIPIYPEGESITAAPAAIYIPNTHYKKSTTLSPDSTLQKEFLEFFMKKEFTSLEEKDKFIFLEKKVKPDIQRVRMDLGKRMYRNDYPGFLDYLATGGSNTNTTAKFIPLVKEEKLLDGFVSPVRATLPERENTFERNPDEEKAILVEYAIKQEKGNKKKTFQVDDAIAWLELGRPDQEIIDWMGEDILKKAKKKLGSKGERRDE